MDASEIVPAPVIGPPVRPVPVATLVTVPAALVGAVWRCQPDRAAS